MPNVERPYKAFGYPFYLLYIIIAWRFVFAIVTVHQNKYERLGCGDYAHWDSSVLFDESKEVFFNYEL
jgi:hypothetical protein